MKKSYILPLVCIFFLLVSCQDHRVYDHFEHTPLTGWEKNDSQFFNIPQIVNEDNYNLNLGLRISSIYPYQSLTLIVRQTVYPKTEKKGKGHQTSAVQPQRTYVDTMNCRLISPDGKSRGKGIGSIQYQFHVTNIHLNRGDSVHICVSHDMKQEILPGISDIGIECIRE